MLIIGELINASRKDIKVAIENLKKAEGMFKEMGMEYYLTKTHEALGRL